MRIKFCLTIFLVICISACVSKAKRVPQAPITEGSLSIIVDVKGLRCCDGVLRLAVYHTAASWMSDTEMVRGRLGFVQSEEQRFEVHGLPAGRYAVAVFQDINSDNKLDRWFGLVPKEPYGFSNNVGQYGPASFNKASFDLTADKTINIQLNSWRN